MILYVRLSFSPKNDQNTGKIGIQYTHLIPLTSPHTRIPTSPELILNQMGIILKIGPLVGYLFDLTGMSEPDIHLQLIVGLIGIDRDIDTSDWMEV